MCLDWNDEIEYDGLDSPKKNELKPSEQLIKYLETLFDPSDFVGYVTDDVWNDGTKYYPSKGFYDRTSGELIELLKKHPDDIGAV